VILLKLHLELVLAAIRSIFSCTNLLLTLQTVLVCLLELTMTMHWSSGFSSVYCELADLAENLIACPMSPTYGARLFGLWYTVCWTPKSHDKSRMRASLKLHNAVLTESMFEFWVAITVWTVNLLRFDFESQVIDWWCQTSHWFWWKGQQCLQW